ncbi:NADPH-dependent F420 reductase [Propionibacterium australiense]|uniref:Diguanylate cyclase n=1 Tax=Propionibacterium australiense TaxID=119981 RepID=A0A8B3FN41_9ACTN|nr:NAD(P)-binding domain-containing protein [Propionibacterium australiense]RLP07690.1 diguanylate cyclase [Propionibacterium australiense]
MTSVSVIGVGSIGSAVASVFVAADTDVQVLARDTTKAVGIGDVTVSRLGDPITGDVVVLSLPYPAVADVLDQYGASAFAGKIVVDPTNPVTIPELASVLPAGTSAADEIAAKLPDARVVKAFNTNFAATIATGKASNGATTVVLAAGDDDDAKATVRSLVEGGGLAFADGGGLANAVRLEAVGAVGMHLALTEQISWTGGLLITA